MTEIILDGKRAVPNANSTIKLTCENTFFTKSASYTYDVELPLDIVENREIFGWINRFDMSKNSRVLEARLVVDNETVLSGTAHITQVSETSVKVQLLGESAAYNYGNKMDKTFIDELNLGDWYTTTWPDDYPDGTKIKGTTSTVVNRAGKDGSVLQNFINGNYPWVAFPVVNSNAEMMCNTFAYMFDDNSGKELSLFYKSYQGIKGREGRSPEPPVDSAAIQPFVWVMAEKIAAATGFTLERGDNALFSNNFFRRIFIVNANNMIECNKCLPHWSVNEWWTQIENTFGLIMTVDYATRRMFLRHRVEHYRLHAGICEVTEAVDEYTTDVDDDSETDISTNNVGFAEADFDPADFLSDYILDNAEYDQSFASPEQLAEWASEKGAKEMATRKNIIFECEDGRHFIYSSKEGILEVNQFRNRYVPESENKGVEVELKFVPARYVEDVCNIYPFTTRHPGAAVRPDSPVGSFPVKVLQVPDISDMEWYRGLSDTDLDIERLVDGDDEEVSSSEEKDDVIYMAIANPMLDTLPQTIKFESGFFMDDLTFDFQYPRALLRSRCVAPLGEAPKYEDAPFSLSLIPIDGQTNIGTCTIVNAIQANTKVKYCISFIHDRIPDPGEIFIIRNRRFVCEKIEANINPKGLDRLLTGYFFELEL